MKRYTYIWLLVCFLFMGQIIEAQVNIGGKPRSFDKELKIKARHSNGNAIVTTPALDMEKIRKEDKINDSLGKLTRIGYPIEVLYDLKNSGEWIDLDNGDRLWQLIISSPGATSIYLNYSKFWLPDGASFFIYDSLKTKHIGGFTSKNNKGTKEKPGKFATADLKSDKLILEYYEPKQVKDQGIISVSSVIHCYLSSGISAPLNFGKSSCNVNINCSPEGDNWQNQKKSVMKIIRNGSPCSGFLINNLNNDGALYVVTSSHCLESGQDAITNPDASNWLFYWNYESSNCENGNNFDPPVTTGAKLIANNIPRLKGLTDFALFGYILNISAK